MNASARKTATIHHIRKSEARAQDSGRTIITTYYESAAKDFTARVIRSMHAATAVPNVIRHMQRNDYNARVAVVWDEKINEILVSIRVDVTGEMHVLYFYDPITGEKLRPQPMEKSKTGLSKAQYNTRMERVMEQLQLALHSEEQSTDVVDALVDQMTMLRTIRK